jgi:amidase
MNRENGNRINSGELDEIGISDLSRLLRNRKMSVLELTDYYLERIEKIDRDGPSLNSILELNPDVRAIAKKMDDDWDAETAGGKVSKEEQGSLAGIPVLIKGNIDTADGMTTTAGSLALAGNRPRRDAGIVRRLRSAGAVILGKTNLSEWANFRSTRSSSGWSSQGGQTKNPYILDRNPCGSSSGSGAAVSANLCAVAVGTETDGSIICPSSVNGIVGIKPSAGLVSRQGIIPISSSQDTAGPMARTVEDGAILLSVLADNDLMSKGLLSTLEAASESPAAYLNGLRVGIVRNFFGVNPQVDALMEQALEVLRKAGAVVIDTTLETRGAYDEAEMTVLLYEFKAGLNAYAAQCTADSGVRSLSDIIAWNRVHEKQVMPWFGQELLEMAAEKGPLTDEDYLQARRKARELAGDRGIDAMLRKDRLDVLTAPSGGPAWKTDWVNGDHFSLGSSSAAAVAGYPNITVPAGLVHGLPVGISFFGPAHTENRLLGIARAYEKLTACRRPPEFLPGLRPQTA